VIAALRLAEDGKGEYGHEEHGGDRAHETLHTEPPGNPMS
jgi:hypothetical protein